MHLRFKKKKQSLNIWTELYISNYYLASSYTGWSQWLLDCCDHGFESCCKNGCLSLV